MLRERYTRRNLFEEIEGISLGMEPVLTQLDRLLDDDALFRAVKGGLSQRYPKTLVTGRGSTPVEVVLRILVVKHLYGWSYEQTEQWVSDSLVLRQFCRVYLEKVPDDTTLIRWANLIQPRTLQELLDHVMELARRSKVTKGRKLRIDGTVVETNIHHPTDSTLLQDGVRVLGRLVKRAGRRLHGGGTPGQGMLRQLTQTARDAWLNIVHAAQRRGEEAEASMKDAYQTLLTVSQALLEQARQAKDTLQRVGQPDAQRLADQLTTFIPRVQQVIRQTQRRVLNGESVPAHEKLVSLFEPHTAIIRKGKAGKAVEFGRVVWLDEVEGGIVSRYAILPGNPPDADQLRPSLDHHRQVFDASPHLRTADRKVFSPKGEAYATQCGVKYVANPKPGACSSARRVHLAGCTATPDSAWVTQQARQLMWQLSDEPVKMRFLVHDHDAKFSLTFDNIFVSEGLEIVLTPFQAPKANAVAERWVRSAREECLDHLLILNQRHLGNVLTDYTAYYNAARPHQGRSQQAPIPLIISREGRVCCHDVLGGVIHDYSRQAA